MDRSLLLANFAVIVLDKKKIRLSTVFVIASVVGVLLTIGVLFFTSGNIWFKLFFTDTRDTGMDFFHSIEYVKGRSPYVMWGTLYPPLANMFFWFLFKLVPDWQFNSWPTTFTSSVQARGTDVDLRTHQSTLLMFIIFIMVCALVVILMVQKALKEDKNATLCAVACLFSFNILYALERGNIVVLAFACCLFFVIFRNSENKILSELSLILLAIAAALKIYPAFLGLLLILDKKYLRAIRTVIYGVVLFFVPFFFFKEGIHGLPVFLSKIFKRTGTGVTVNWRVNGFSFDRMFNNLISIVEENSHVVFDKALISGLAFKLNTGSAVVCLACAFFMKKEWQKVLCCILGILYFNNQSVYGLCLLLIVLIVMIRSEKFVSKSTIVPLLCIINSCVILPVIDWNEHSYSIRDLRIQIGLFVLFVYIIAIAVKNVVIGIKAKKTDVKIVEAVSE